MNKYVLINLTGGVTWYGIIVLDEYLTFDVEDVTIKYGLSYTDDINDATKFTCIGAAFEVMEKVCTSPEDWDVILYTEEK